MNASAILERQRARIRSEGQPLVVTRRPAMGGASPVTQTVYFLPQSAAGTGGDISVEGNTNATEPNEYDFVCVGDADVRAGLDTIAFNGGHYKVNNVNPTP